MYAMDSKLTVKDLQAERRPLYIQERSINKKNKHTPEEVAKLENIYQQIIASCQEEIRIITSSTPKKPQRKNYFEIRQKELTTRIENYATKLAMIQRSKNDQSKDLTESSVLRFDLERHENKSKKCFNRLGELTKQKAEIRKQLLELQKQKQASTQENTDPLTNQESQTNNSYHGSLEQYQSNMQRKEWIKQLVLVNAKLQMAIEECPTDKDVFLNLYNEKIYLLFQIMDNYKREQDTIQDSSAKNEPCIKWTEELEAMCTERAKILGYEQLQEQLNTSNSSPDLSNLFASTETVQSDLEKKIELSTLETIKEEKEEVANKQLTNLEQPEQEQKTTPSLLSRIYTFFTPWNWRK